MQNYKCDLHKNNIVAICSSPQCFQKSGICQLQSCKTLHNHSQSKLIEINQIDQRIKINLQVFEQKKENIFKNVKRIYQNIIAQINSLINKTMEQHDNIQKRIKQQVDVPSKTSLILQRKFDQVTGLEIHEFTQLDLKIYFDEKIKRINQNVDKKSKKLNDIECIIEKFFKDKQIQIEEDLKQIQKYKQDDLQRRIENSKIYITKDIRQFYLNQVVAQINKLIIKNSHLDPLQFPDEKRQIINKLSIRHYCIQFYLIKGKIVPCQLISLAVQNQLIIQECQIYSQLACQIFIIQQGALYMKFSVGIIRENIENEKGTTKCGNI